MKITFLLSFFTVWLKIATNNSFNWANDLGIRGIIHFATGGFWPPCCALKPSNAQLAMNNPLNWVLTEFTNFFLTVNCIFYIRIFFGQEKRAKREYLHLVCSLCLTFLSKPSKELQLSIPQVSASKLSSQSPTSHHITLSCSGLTQHNTTTHSSLVIKVSLSFPHKVKKRHGQRGAVTTDKYSSRYATHSCRLRLWQS